jgi:hypothetical protein
MHALICEHKKIIIINAFKIYAAIKYTYAKILQYNSKKITKEKEFKYYFYAILSLKIILKLSVHDSILKHGLFYYS